MKFRGQLYEATLLKRTLKFLAEIALRSNKRMLIRCPNLRELQGCDVLGSRVWYSNSSSEQYLHTWELVEIDSGHIVSVNHEHKNTLVIEGITQGVIEELQGYNILQRNVGFDDESVIDIVLENNGEKCFVNVEYITYSNGQGDGFFPDSLAIRAKHLHQLSRLKQLGHRAVMIYCVQNTGIECVRPADHIHPHYCRTLRQAVIDGVEVLAYKSHITLDGMALAQRLPVLLSEEDTRIRFSS